MQHGYSAEVELEGYYQQQQEEEEEDLELVQRPSLSLVEYCDISRQTILLLFYLLHHPFPKKKYPSSPVCTKTGGILNFILLLP